VDSSYEVDLNALLTAVRERDHLVFRFATIPLRLFLDFRTTAEDGPFVAVLPAVDSVKERMATIRAVRPRLPRPKRINVVAWPLRVGALERLAIIEAVRLRLADMDAFPALTALDDAIRELEAAERAEVRRAITGEGYKTLWPATPAT
jgi:hypothetical protein